MNVKAEFVDNKKEFKWRLIKGNEVFKWSKWYEGILVHTFKDGTKYELATQYWSGESSTSLLTEKPFQIIEHKLI